MKRKSINMQPSAGLARLPALAERVVGFLFARHRIKACKVVSVSSRVCERGTKPCEICHDTGHVDVLDVWTIQRAHMQYGDVSIDHADALPMIKQAVRCPTCYGADAMDADMQVLEERMGGNPFADATYQNG
jgi:hypothetical protein